MRHAISRSRGVFAAAAVAGLVVWGCEGGGPVVGADSVPEGATDVPFTDVAAAQASGFTDRARLVIEDPDALADFWATYQGPRSQTSDPPAVDFETSTVIAAAMGERGTGGYSVTIDEVREHDGTLYVRVTELSPGPTCMTTQALTQPVSAVRVDVKAGRVEFVETADTSSCE